MARANAELAEQPKATQEQMVRDQCGSSPKQLKASQEQKAPHYTPMLYFRAEPTFDLFPKLRCERMLALGRQRPRHRFGSRMSVLAGHHSRTAKTAMTSMSATRCLRASSRAFHNARCSVKRGGWRSGQTRSRRFRCLRPETRLPP